MLLTPETDFQKVNLGLDLGPFGFFDVPLDMLTCSHPGGYESFKQALLFLLQTPLKASSLGYNTFVARQLLSSQRVIPRSCLQKALPLLLENKRSLHLGGEQRCLPAMAPCHQGCSCFSGVPRPLHQKILWVLPQVVQNPTPAPLHSYRRHPGGATPASPAGFPDPPLPGAAHSQPAAGAQNPSRVPSPHSRGQALTVAQGTGLTTISLPIPVDPSGSPAGRPHNPGMLLPQGLCTGHSVPWKCFSYRHLHGQFLYGLEVFSQTSGGIV